MRMRKASKNILDLPLEERALVAIREGVRKAIAEHRRLGIPAYVLLGGKVVDINAPRARKRTAPAQKRPRSASNIR
jgi:hypothetical protein